MAYTYFDVSCGIELNVFFTDRDWLLSYVLETNKETAKTKVFVIKSRDAANQRRILVVIAT
jgi:hypothetical protein